MNNYKIRYTFENKANNEKTSQVRSLNDIENEKRGDEIYMPKIIENYRRNGYELINREIVQDYDIWTAMKMSFENPNIEFEDFEKKWFLKHCMGVMKTCKQNEGYYSSIYLNEEIINKRWFIIER